MRSPPMAAPGMLPMPPKTAAVLGGIGNIRGAALGGLCIGMFEAFWNSYFLSEWTQVMIFVILTLVLLFRPSGLLGMRVPDRT